MLRKHKKLTKKELKQDPLVIFAAQAADFLEREWLKIVAVVGTVVLIIGLSYMIVSGRDKNALSAYDAALLALSSDAPEALDMLRHVADDYGGSDIADEAVINLANQYFQIEDYDNAEQYFKRYLDKFSNDAIYTFNAYNGLGAIYEGRGEYQQAALTYADYVKSHTTGDVFMLMMALNAGKAYLSAGDTTAAVEYFQTILESHGDSREKEEASFYLEMIK